MLCRPWSLSTRFVLRFSAAFLLKLFWISFRLGQLQGPSQSLPSEIVVFLSQVPSKNLPPRLSATRRDVIGKLKISILKVCEAELFQPWVPFGEPPNLLNRNPQPFVTQF
jgi:hypothetical protein